MPTYEYQCKKCGYGFEEFQSISEPPLRRCPRCRGRVRRLLGTGAAVIFKGPGFYQTDYRSPSYLEKAKKEGEALTDGSQEKSKAKDGSKTAGENKETKKGQDS